MSGDDVSIYDSTNRGFNVTRTAPDADRQRAVAYQVECAINVEIES